MAKQLNPDNFWNEVENEDKAMKMPVKASKITSPNLWVTLSGEQGVGKTTFALEWPDPVIIAVENGLKSVKHKDPDVYPVKSSIDVRNTLHDLKTHKHKFKTVCIDSVTALESMFTQELLKKGNADSLAQYGGGYGRGHQALAGKMCTFAEACKELLPKMHVIMILHSEIETFHPEDSEPFDRLTIRVHKTSKQYFLDGPDIVAFLRQKKEVHKTSGSHIAIGTGKRELLCHTCPSATSKNRIGIDSVLDLDLETNPILNTDQRMLAVAESAMDI